MVIPVLHSVELDIMIQLHIITLCIQSFQQFNLDNVLHKLFSPVHSI
jgi:hypothetical protein